MKCWNWNCGMCDQAGESENDSIQVLKCLNCPSFFGASCYCAHFCVKMKTAQKGAVHLRYSALQ